MDKKYSSKKNIMSLLFIVLPFIFLQQSYSQVTGTQEIKWLSVGSLRQWFSNGGAEIEYGRRGRAHMTTDQIDGLIWPAENLDQDINVGKSLWIGTTYFADPIDSTLYPHKVICAGRLYLNIGTEIFPEQMELVGRFGHPTVTVDNIPASDLNQNDVVDEIDPGLKADRMIFNTIHTPIGISVTRKVLSFSQQYHDNYFICEYVFKNTGIIDSTNQKKLDTTLTDVIFHWQYRYAFAGESYHGGWAPTGASWGLNTINDVMDPVHPGEFRAFWAYYGPVSLSHGVMEDIGCPNYTNGSIMAGTKFAGVVVLHADKSPLDSSDDPAQPSTTHYTGSDQDFQSDDQHNATLMTNKYGVISRGHPAQSHAEYIGKDPATGWPVRFPTTVGLGDPGGYSSAQGFGPYTMGPGDSVRIIVAEAVAGIHRVLNKEVTGNWFANTGPFILPNGSSTSDRNIYKNTWVFTGKDSLFQTFRRIVANYTSSYQIPVPPPPPDEFTVASGTNKITLDWSNSAESWPGFDGYRIYRAEVKPDTTYKLVFSCDKNNSVNHYEDVTAIAGLNNFYYIQTKDDGSTNTGSTVLNIPAGEPLVSSKFYTMTNRGASVTTSIQNNHHSNYSFSLGQNFPNPFNPQTTIEFMVPKKDFVSIKIYNILGKEVVTLVNEELDAGSYATSWNAWNFPSGVYIYRLLTNNFMDTKKMTIIK